MYVIELIYLHCAEFERTKNRNINKIFSIIFSISIEDICVSNRAFPSPSTNDWQKNI